MNIKVFLKLLCIMSITLSSMPIYCVKASEVNESCYNVMLTKNNNINISETPSLQIDASKNEGIYGKSILGNMFEWASDYMNGAWAQKVTNRNFETDVYGEFSSPLYDNFSDDTLNHSKWTMKTYGSNLSGECVVNGSHMTLTGVSDARFGVLSRSIYNKNNADIIIKADILECTGKNAMLSLIPNNSEDFTNNIEFGVDDGRIKVFGDGIETFIGEETLLPATIKISVSHLKGNERDISFLLNDRMVYSVQGFKGLGEKFNIFLYGWGLGKTVWDTISVYSGNIYDDFDVKSYNFIEDTIDGEERGSVNYQKSKAIINGKNSKRFGLMSNTIHNSSTNWTYIEAKLDSVSGMNGLLHISDNDTDKMQDFVEFGIEEGVLKVFTSSGLGNWQGKNMQVPCVLRVETSPYYANGRNIRFYCNDELVYALWENKEIKEKDYKLFLYGYGNSVTKWDWIKLRQEHFTDVAGPNFEGGSLPNDWEISSLNHGRFGIVDSHDGFCKIHGKEGSRFGVGTMSYENSDIKPFKFVAKLDRVIGLNGLLHLTTSEPHGDFVNFLEYGVENGNLTIFTPARSWTGKKVELPVILEIELYPNKRGGRDLVFICNGEPVYTMDNYSYLENKEIRAFIYGYGDTTTVWDYVDGYQISNWEIDGTNAWGTVVQDEDSEAISGRYLCNIKVDKSNNGKLGISQRGIDIIDGHKYEISAWIKAEGEITGVDFSLISDGKGFSETDIYANEIISNLSSVMKKYTFTLIPNKTDSNAKLFIGVSGVGNCKVDQVSVMPLEESDVVYGGWRRDFVDKLRDLKCGSLRWPGGIISDWYYWDRGIGERDKRAPLYFAQWNASWMNNDVGIDEFLDLCSKLSISPVLNVNYAIKDPFYAADFVEYVNGSAMTKWGNKRAQNGVINPYSIVYWEIGNETWGSWVPNPEDAETFSDGYIEYYTKMKEKDNSICCIGEGGDGNSYNQEWNKKIIDKAGNKMDGISIHYYSPQHLPIAYSDTDVFKASVFSPISVKERITEAQKLISQIGYDIKIAVTEYNAMYFHSLRHRTRSMEAAIQVAGLLNVFLSYPGMTDHNDYSCLAQFWDGSCIRFGTKGLYTTPTYDILNLYSNKRGEMKIMSQLNSPTVQSLQIGNTPAITNAKILDGLVTRNKRGNKIYISLLNRSETDSYSIPISIKNCKVSSYGRVYTVASNDFLDENSWLEPDKIKIEERSINGLGNDFNYSLPKLSLTVIELNATGLKEISNDIICGKVIDDEGSPIESASIFVDGHDTNIKTNNSGYFEVVSGKGKHTIYAVKEGYFDGIMRNVKLYSIDGVTTQPIYMKRNALIQ